MNSFKAQDDCFPTHINFDDEKTGEDRTVQNKGIRFDIYPSFHSNKNINEYMYETITDMT